jgi:hypothetical protein
MKFEQLSVIFPANPVSKGVGRGLDVGWLDWLDEAAVAGEAVVDVVDVGAVVAVIDTCFEDEEVVVDEEEEVEEEDESSLVASLSSISNPRRWSASCSVSRVQALGLGGGRVS